MSAVLEKVTNLAQLRQQPQAPEASMPVVHAGYTSLQGFELMQRAAKALSASTLVPAQYQGNVPNAMIALEMAQRIGASPLMVAQNLYIVHGRPGWSAKFLIATFNQCGRFTSLRFEWQGTRGQDDWGCRAWATEKATGEKIEGPLITIALAKAEGWDSKNGSKWKTIPELMLTYRAAAWMINTHAPEISMGLNSAEEITDVYDAQRDSSGGYSVTLDSLAPAEPEPAAPVVEDQHAAEAQLPGVEPPTFAEVAELIGKAEDLEALDFARSHISMVQDTQHQAELNAEAAKRLKQIKGK